MFVSRDPYDGRIIQTFRSHSPARLQLIADRAALAQVRWAATSPGERAACLSRLAAGLRARAGELAATITSEMGKRSIEALQEVEKCALACDFYATHGPAFLEPEQFATEASQSHVEYPPLGVVLAVMPWNFPLWLIVRCAIPALLAGNAVLVKPAPSTPATAFLLESLVAEAGVVAEAFRVVLAEPSRLESLIAHPAVAMVAVTGSSATGEAVSTLAARHLKRSLLELGGSDPFIVFADADLGVALREAVAARFLNCGQSCIAPKRFIVVPALADEWVEGLRAAIADLRVGDPRAKATDIGPMASRDAARHLRRQVRDSLRAGATRLVGTDADPGGALFPPTLLDHVAPGMPAFDEELFGPVACVVRAKDEDDALRLAAATRYGLGASLWTADIERAQKLARFMPVGMVAVNAPVHSDPRLPFGGVKASGYGRELSYHGLREFTAPRSVWIS